MVIQSKKYPIDGSQQLISFHIQCQAVTGVVGGTATAFILEYLTPYYCFGIFGVSGLLVAMVACLIPSEMEEDQTVIIERRGFCNELKQNYLIVKDCLRCPEMYRSLMFFFFCGFTLPRFDSFMYFFKTEVAGFSQFQYTMLTLTGGFAMIVGIQIYKMFFKLTEVRKLFTFALLLLCFSSFLDICFILRWN